jgi:nucleoside-diphosphate-sugar epimerase
MTILITGGTGFIGAEVVRFLLHNGVSKPVVFDIAPNLRRLADIADQVEVLRGDLGTFSHVLDVVRQVHPTTIYHLGAMLSAPSEADPPAALRVNALGTFHVLEAARLFNVPQVLFSSSVGTYGLDMQGELRLHPQRYA